MFLILTGLILTFFVTLFIITSTIHKKQFAYNTHQDYNYPSLPSTAHATLKGGSLTLPTTISGQDTVIAKLRIKSTWAGLLALPFVETISSKGKWKQYFEYGAKGVRYINLSDTFSDSDKAIRLEGKYLTLPDQEIELSVYPRENLDGKKILVLAPHADDAELSAYGLYEKHAANSMICTLTASEGGSFHYGNLYGTCDCDTQAQYLQKGRMCVWNSLTVPLLAGVPSENILQLGYFDSTLTAMRQNPEKEIKSTKIDTTDVDIFRHANTSPLAQQLKPGSTWNSLVDNLGYLIETFQPDIIVSPSPNIDTHPDHQHTTLAAIEALRKIDYRRGNLFLHTIHYLSDDFPIGKVGSSLSLPPLAEQPFYFQSIYSHPLDKEEQNRKLLALDAMNDIRPNSDGYMRWNTMIFKGLNKLRHHILHIDKDLVNRFVRSNEFFYSVPITDLYQEETLKKITYQGKAQ